MAHLAELARWRRLIERLVASPFPRGDQFDLCRRVLALAQVGETGATAARQLLEGSMTDAGTPIDTAQEVMALLRALDRCDVSLEAILSSP
jgi:hypothetical protein